MSFLACHQERVSKASILQRHKDHESFKLKQDENEDLSFKKAVSLVSTTVLPLDVIIFLAIETHKDKKRCVASIVGWLQDSICQSAKTDFDVSKWTKIIKGQLVADHRFHPVYTEQYAGLELWVVNEVFLGSFMQMLRGNNTLFQLRHFLPNLNSLIQQLFKSTLPIDPLLDVNQGFSVAHDEPESEDCYSQQKLPSHLSDHSYSIISSTNYQSGIQIKTETNSNDCEKKSQETYTIGSAEGREFGGFKSSYCPVYQLSECLNMSIHDCVERRCHEKYECPLQFVSPDSVSNPDQRMLKMVRGNRRKQNITVVSEATAKLERTKTDCNDNEIQAIIGESGSLTSRPNSDKFDPLKKGYYCVRDEGNRWTMNGKMIKRNENGERLIRINRYNRPGRPSMTKEQKKVQAVLRKRKYEKILSLTVEEKLFVDDIVLPASDKTKKRRRDDKLNSETVVDVKQETDFDQVGEKNELVVVGDVETEDTDLEVDVTDESVEIDDDCIIKEICDLETSSVDLTNDYKDLFISCSDDTDNIGRNLKPEFKKKQPPSLLGLGRSHSIQMSSVKKRYPKKSPISLRVNQQKQSNKTSSCNGLKKSISRSKDCNSSESFEKGNLSGSVILNPESQDAVSGMSSKSAQSEPGTTSKRTRPPYSQLSDFHLPMSDDSSSYSPTKSGNRLLSLSSKSTLSSLLIMKRNLKATKNESAKS